MPIKADSICWHSFRNFARRRTSVSKRPPIVAHHSKSAKVSGQWNQPQYHQQPRQHQGHTADGNSSSEQPASQPANATKLCVPGPCKNHYFRSGYIDVNGIIHCVIITVETPLLGPLLRMDLCAAGTTRRRHKRPWRRPRRRRRQWRRWQSSTLPAFGGWRWSRSRSGFGPVSQHRPHRCMFQFLNARPRGAADSEQTRTQLVHYGSKCGIVLE